MLWRVRDILEVIAPAMQVTLCDAASAKTCLDAYNRINEILMGRNDWPGTEADVCFTTNKGCITLPAQFGAITALSVDNSPARILPTGFEYLEGGPGHISMYSPDGILQHLGDRFATFADLPGVMSIACWSDMQEENASLRLYGTDGLGRELRDPEGVPGVNIPIKQASPEIPPAMAPVKISSLTALVKPVTKGYVEVLAFNEHSKQYIWLSRLSQHETAPSLTRYFLTGVDSKHPVSVRARVSLQFTPLYALDDISLIQHREVYRLMAQAIRGFDDENGALGSQYQERAVKMLNDAVGKHSKGQRKTLNISTSHRPTRPGRSYTIRNYR